MNACTALTRAIDSLAADTDDPRKLLLGIGTVAAGIRPGVRGYLDLATGGRNRISGRGMAAPFDDDSDGQARHFAGIATASARVRPRLARWLSVHIGRDAPTTADGRLTDLAVEFAAALLSGELPTTEAAEWVHARLCV